MGAGDSPALGELEVRPREDPAAVTPLPQAYFFSAFFDDSSDFLEPSDFWELSDFEESSDFDLPSFLEDESPLEELEEEEGAEDFLA